MNQRLTESSLPSKDSIIYFRAEGKDAKAALDALVMLVDGDFQNGP